MKEVYKKALSRLVDAAWNRTTETCFSIPVDHENDADMQICRYVDSLESRISELEEKLNEKNYYSQFEYEDKRTKRNE